MEVLRANWPIIAAVVVIAAILLFLLLKPRQRVRLSNDNVPQRPHMVKSPSREGRGLASEAAAATTDIAGEIINAKVHQHLPGASAPPDDLQRLKGVGPRFAALLGERGITHFAQIAHMSPEETERLDAALGPFRGRLQRDRIPEQADYLARGDTEGYEARFGKL